MLLSTGLAAISLAVPAVASQAPPGAGSSFVTEVSASSWYWAGTSPKAGGTTLPANAPVEASNVPAGDRGVGFTNQVDKVTALGFATRGLPTGAVFSTFAVTMGLDPAVHQLAQSTPSLVACDATAEVPANREGAALSAAPDTNLLACVPGAFDAAKQTYTFDLKAIATQWAAGATAHGVVVRPKVGATTAFSYAFRPDATYAVTARYTPALAPATSPATSPALRPMTAVPPAPSAPMALDPVISLPLIGITPMVVPALSTEPLLAPVPAAAPVLLAAAVPQVLRRIPADSLRPTGAFWLAGLGLTALLGAVALVVGDPMAPAAPDARRRRFAQVVRTRSAAQKAPAHAPAPARRTFRAARPV